jgi:uncharacterized protein GlcG (DUF336 family)
VPVRTTPGPGSRDGPSGRPAHCPGDERFRPLTGSFYEMARKIVDQGFAYASEHGQRMVVAVVDATFTLAAAGRMDGAYPSCVGSAIAKAHTAVNFGTATDKVKDRTPLDIRIGLAGADQRLIFVGGGLPIMLGGEIVGGVGVAGGSEEEDIECASAALKEIIGGGGL